MATPCSTKAATPSLHTLTHTALQPSPRRPSFFRSSGVAWFPVKGRSPRHPQPHHTGSPPPPLSSHWHSYFPTLHISAPISLLESSLSLFPLQTIAFTVNTYTYTHIHTPIHVYITPLTLVLFIPPIPPFTLSDGIPPACNEWRVGCGHARRPGRQEATPARVRVAAAARALKGSHT